MTLLDNIKSGNYAGVVREIISSDALENMTDENIAELEKDTGMTVADFKSTLSSAIKMMDESMGRANTDLLITAQIKGNPQLEATFLRAAIDAKGKVK